MPRKNGIFLILEFPKNSVYVARFDIPAAITLHTYNLSVHDKHEHVHQGIIIQQTLFDDTRT